MDEIQHALVRCPLRGQSNGNVGAKLERACRTCPGPAPAETNPYTWPGPRTRPNILPRSDHYRAPSNLVTLLPTTSPWTVWPDGSRSVLFNLFVIVEHLIHFRVCHGTLLTKIYKTRITCKKIKYFVIRHVNKNKQLLQKLKSKKFNGWLFLHFWNVATHSEFGHPAKRTHIWNMRRPIF